MITNVKSNSNLKTFSVTDFSKRVFQTITITEGTKDGEILILNKTTGNYEVVKANTAISYASIQNGEVKYVSTNIENYAKDNIKYKIDNILTINELNLSKTNIEIGLTSQNQTAIKGNGLSNKIIGNDLNNVISSFNGNDDINSGKGNDTIYAGNGSDVINGGLGADTMYGEGGNDIYFVDNVEDIIIETLNNGLDTVQSTISYKLGANIENLTFEGQRGNVKGEGNILNNSIKGGLGNDSLYGYEGNDTLYGELGNDTLYGGAGNDKLYGGAGTDILYGGAGNDIYYVEQGDIVIEGINEGIDTVETNSSIELSANIENLTLTGKVGLNANANNSDNKIIATIGNDQINGQGGNDIIYGQAGDDILLGGAGNDILYSGLGSDKLYGGTGSDIYYIENVNDIIVEVSDTGVDTVYSEVSFDLTSYIENINIVNSNSYSTNKSITVNGNELNNIINGGRGIDILNGKDGNDTIFSYSGNDVINGGKGNNILSGGIGKDVFVFSDTIGTFNNTLKDFNLKDDTIFLENQVFSKFNTNGGINSEMFKANIDGLAKDTNDYLVYETDTGKLFYDADGSGAGASVQIATIENKVVLTYQDFLVI